MLLRLTWWVGSGSAGRRRRGKMERDERGDRDARMEGSVTEREALLGWQGE
jgi:hypothetical protein